MRDDDTRIPDEQLLPGGVANRDTIVRVGDEVLRPAHAHSTAIHALLRHLRTVGFDGAPEALGFTDDGRERLRFIPGDVPLPPFPSWSTSERSLASVAALLRRFHDATVGFEAPADSSWSTELADPRGSDVLCHNDVCPENVVFRNGEAVAFLDFDFAAPGRRVFDLAGLASMCIPLDTEEDAARTGRGGVDPFVRLRVVANAYGLTDDRETLVDAIGERFEDGGAFIRRRVAAGERAFVELWQAMGGEARFERRRRWFEQNRQRFLDALG